MNKQLLNILLNIQKRRGILFRIIILTNEVYIKLRAASGKIAAITDPYKKTFLANGKQFSIKRLEEKDLMDLSAFFKNLITFRSLDSVMPHNTDDKSLAGIFKMASHIPLGIYHNDELIGYALIRLLFPNKGSYAIFIADKWQGRGIGTAALREEIDLIRDLGFVPASAVSKNNERSMKMLKKLGIEFTGDMGDYFEVKDRCRR